MYQYYCFKYCILNLKKCRHNCLRYILMEALLRWVGYSCLGGWDLCEVRQTTKLPPGTAVWLPCFHHRFLIYVFMHHPFTPTMFCIRLVMLHMYVRRCGLLHHSRQTSLSQVVGVDTYVPSICPPPATSQEGKQESKLLWPYNIMQCEDVNSLLFANPLGQGG